ncbi:UDP-2,4-diacetamido-2,4,6-trideoxy-beta-L-altropyranose hydrolase [Maridesulfovibrio sp.]|uniref:UDP-2,4-diacetamido-2,4, 6-trideoxy-beta-L-altropyranose hydrolase n=1 Tax=Maridesulfovibrio sp. TaxID=2795000 RepID=UPI0029F512A0|nr:UDP-2,4-diacetamido-2,4,6-trideoxy-beta-L-altropyranose hydrolase [Maridesulfovibrio sp.]
MTDNKTASTPKTLLIRADANSSIGIGHVMRCLALAEEWIARGGDAVLAGNISNQALLETITKFGLKFVSIKASYPDSEQDAKQLINIARPLAAGSWIVLDGYFFDAEYQNQIRQAHPNTLVMDDYNHLDEYDCAVLLNQNLGSESIKYRINPDAQILAGVQYTMLRNEFRKAAQNKLENPGNEFNILISMGGADAKNSTATILKALNEVPADMRIKVIAGPANPHLENLYEQARTSVHDIEIKSNVSNMAELIAASDLFIGAGGSSCWEVCCIGRPLIIISTADNQLRIAEQLQAAGAALYLGKDESVQKNEITESVKMLVNDSEIRQNLAQNGHKLVDGNGVSRIIDFLNRA